MKRSIDDIQVETMEQIVKKGKIEKDEFKEEIKDTQDTNDTKNTKDTKNIKEKFGKREIPLLELDGALEKYNIDEVKESISKSRNFGYGTMRQGPSKILTGTLVDTYALNGLVAAVHISFSEHIPLALSLDHLSIPIVQAIAHHINFNPEKYRSFLVQHLTGQEDIKVDNDHLTKDGENLENHHQWSLTVEMLQSLIAKKTEGKVTSTIKNDLTFSTTNVNASVAMSVAILDTVSSFFKYHVRTKCGIPSIQLLGNLADWNKLKTFIDTFPFDQLDLSEWKIKLQYIVNNCVLTAARLGELGQLGDQVETKDRDDELIKFWKNIYHHLSGSGRSSLDGWLGYLYPYDKDKNPTKWFTDLSNESKVSKSKVTISLSELPSGLSSVPFIWHNRGTSLNMNLVGGFGDAKFDENEIQPTLGWSIAYRSIDR